MSSWKHGQPARFTGRESAHGRRPGRSLVQLKSDGAVVSSRLSRGGLKWRGSWAISWI
jgi:hypothetical protein